MKKDPTDEETTAVIHVTRIREDAADPQTEFGDEEPTLVDARKPAPSIAASVQEYLERKPD